MMLPAEVGGSGLGPRTLAAVIAALAEADASVAMVYLMHVCAAATIASARRSERVANVVTEIAAGRHLSTLAFSEAGSRSHFWAAISRARVHGAGVRITAKKSWVTSAGHAQSYVVSSLAPEVAGPTDSTLYLIPAGASGLAVAGPWDGLGMRANASAPMTLDECEVPSEFRLTDDGAGFQAMLNVVLPPFNLGTSAVAWAFVEQLSEPRRRISRGRDSTILVRALAKVCRPCERSWQRCRSKPTASRRASTTWSITLNGHAKRRCCACSKPRLRRARPRLVSPRPRCARAGRRIFEAHDRRAIVP